MPRGFASALFGIALLSFPVHGETPAWDDAVAKAARISGLWVATPDPAQSSVLPAAPFPVSRLFMNIHTRIRREGEEVETTLAEARLDLEQRVDLASPAYLYDIPLGDPVPIAGDGMELNGESRCCEGPSEVGLRIVPHDGAQGLTVLISSAGKSAYIEFGRPAPNPNAPAQGDWISDGRVLHIYVMDAIRIAATFDMISPNQTDLGYPFSDSGSDLKTGSLMMHLDTNTTFNSFDGRLDGPDLLRVQWRGSGSLSGPEFHRQSAGNGARAIVPKW